MTRVKGPVGTTIPALPHALGRKLEGLVGDRHVITDPDRLLVYESDGLTQYRHRPAAVVLPGNSEELREVVRILHLEGRAFVARGAGTGLSGGALALQGAVVIGTSRLNRILEIDPGNRRARVEPGVINASLTRATRVHGLVYAPDPSSQSACTLGGNVAENSGGPHCLKYGVTSRYVRALTVVLPNGETLRLASSEAGGTGPDWVGLFTGSEGCLGVVTEIEVELIPAPEGVRTLLGIFDSLEAAGEAVTGIMAQGVVPAALEIVDQETIRAVEASVFAAGYPVDAGAALVVELDGVDAGLDREAQLVESACLEQGASEVRTARSDQERQALWAGRKKAFGAMGRIAPDLLVQDATVPRSRLPGVLRQIGEIGERYGLTVANVFHAGDGNLHPNLLFDRSDAEELSRVEAASKEIMAVCIEAGGTITGEHGVGIDKRDYMGLVLSDEVLHAMADVKSALDPTGLCNPGKVLPDALPPRPHVEHDHGDAPIGTVAVESESHAAELLARAARAGTPVRVGEGGTTRGLPAGPHLHLTDSELTGVLEHSPADLTVRVGAGTPVGALQAAVRGAGQWFPVDAPGADHATLGRVIAAGSWGPLRAGYGRPRDHLLGATLVTGEGRVLELGGRVVKNVAGFDLLRLLVGSRGALGLITSLTLRLFPVPESDRTLVWERQDAVGAARLGRELAATKQPVAALEWWLGGAVAGVSGRGPHGTVAARLHGSATAVEAMERRLADAAGVPERSLGGDESHSWWQERARQAGPRRVPTLADRASDVARVLAEGLEGADATPAASMSLISGGVRIRSTRSAEDAVRRAGGIPPAEPIDLSEVIRVFDPAGILPGRWREGWI